MLIFADKAALITSGIITVLCVIFYFAYSHRKECVMPTIEEEIGVIEEPDEQTKLRWTDSTPYGRYAQLLLHALHLESI